MSETEVVNLTINTNEIQSSSDVDFLDGQQDSKDF
jgi:hypothetical protein